MIISIIPATVETYAVYVEPTEPGGVSKYRVVCFALIKEEGDAINNDHYYVAGMTADELITNVELHKNFSHYETA